MENNERPETEGEWRSDEREEGELEEGQMDEHATKSPLPRTTQATSGAVVNRAGEGAHGRCSPVRTVRAHNSNASNAITTLRAQAHGASTSARPVDESPVRAPPTAPRAMRQSMGNHTANVPSTPRAQFHDAAPLGARQAVPAQHGYAAGQRRAASAHHDAPAAKRQRPQPVVINTVPDPLGNKILRLETLVNEKDKQIEDLQWKLAEAQALFHIYKTRGPDHFDSNLNEHIKRKFWTRNNPDRAKNNWRLDELSDISDEEPVRSPARRPSPSHRAPSSSDQDNGDSSPGQIYTVYGELSDNLDIPCVFDDDADVSGDVAASMDMLAAADALRRGMKARKDATRPDEPSSAAQQLSRQELFEKTAVVQYGLRFSYMLSLWQENGRWLPAPLGRFGQPYWNGSAWEDFDPRRIFMKEGAERVALDSKQFLQLAQDAARIAFVYRSATQRQVVSLALQNNLGLINANEPDMVSLCRTNPSRLPIAIRRHYRRNAQKDIFYTEYDAADISNHIILSLSGPQKVQDGLPRRDYHEQRRAWLQLVEVFVLDWLPLFSSRLVDPETLAQDIMPWPREMDLVARRVQDDELYTAIWTHLSTNGVPRRCLLPGGDFHDYIRRGRIMELERRRLSAAFDEACGQDAVNQEVKRGWVGDRLPYEPVPEGFPVLRVKMGVEKQEQLSMKYRERRNRKSFIPV